MSGSTTSTAKERHYAHLAAQLETLSGNIVDAQHHLRAAASQTRYIKSLGANQAAM
jgi:DASH complex subunit Hsk3 like